MIKDKRLKNRYLSWLKFNERVLQEASDPNVPLAERLRFIGIFSNNFDEFFKVRYANIKKQSENEKDNILEIIDLEIQILQNKSNEIYNDIKYELRKEGILIINEKEINKNQGEFIRKFFSEKIRPSLLTIILNDLDDIPKLKDIVPYLAVKMVLREEEGMNKETENRFFSSGAYKEKTQYALIEVPSKKLGRFVTLPKEGDKQYVILLEDVIRFCLDKIFYIFDYESISAHLIKITRDAELDIDNDLNKSFVDKISLGVEGRKDGQPVRFVYDYEIENDTLEFLKNKLNLYSWDSIIAGGRYHNRKDYMDFPKLDRKDLLYREQTPLPIKNFSLESSMLKQIFERDYLQYTPYHSFSYVINFLREAALDPKVKSIKITIYRLAKQSEIIDSLINAVKNGKKVTAQVELQAKFDEAANIEYSELLQSEGVNLIFGVKGLKVHGKICVVEREEGNKIRKYGFISTGNFNESTAKIYTDYTLFTSNQSILNDASNVFNFLETPYYTQEYKNLIVSPHYTMKSFIRMINQEIYIAKNGGNAFLKFKMNGLTNREIIMKLYEASRAGVKIQLIVRGMCSLLPGVEGLSENIEVISIVDKFLEHTRLYIFGNNGSPKVYISSADMMTRNILYRVEVTCPIYDEQIKKELLDTFEISWSDNVKARIISSSQDNTYKTDDKKPNRSQKTTYDYYKNKLES